MLESTILDSLVTALPFFFVALLYASVGHGGASGYLAVMALMGVEAALLRPTALGLNVAVSIMGTIAFLNAGYFRGRLFWPLILAAMPFAYLGGSLEIHETLFRKLLGVALLLSLLRLFLMPSGAVETSRAPLWLLLVTGAIMGFASGLIGVGGGIFLTPLVIFMRWGSPKVAAAISAPFILLNSLAGLAGLRAGVGDFHPLFVWFLAAVVLAGLLGSIWGSHFAANRHIRWLLGCVLSLAAFKLFL